MYKIISGFENYSIDTKGNIKNNKTERILKNHLNNRGYLDIAISSNDGKPKKFLIHRLVAFVFIDSFSESLQVNHIDGDRQNNSVDNLECIKQIENLSHSKKRREKRGNINKLKTMKLFKSKEWNSVDEFVRELMKY